MAMTMPSLEGLRVKINMHIDDVLKKSPHCTLKDLLYRFSYQLKHYNISQVDQLKHFIQENLLSLRQDIKIAKVGEGAEEEEVIEKDGEIAQIKTLEDLLVYLKNNPMGIRKNVLHTHYDQKIIKKPTWQKWEKIYQEQLVRVSIYKGQVWLSSTEDERLAGMMEPSMTPRNKSIKDDFLKICQREVGGSRQKENKKAGKGQQQTGTGQSENSHIKGFDEMKKEYLEELRKKN